MNVYFVGQPGERPRLLANNPADAGAVAVDGEVVVEGEIGDWVISASGDSLDPWTQPLAELKARMLAAVRNERDERQAAGVATPWGVADTNLEARLNVAGAVSLAMVQGDDFAITWRMFDNTLVELDAADMQVLGQIVAQHIALCQYRKNDLDVEIESAASMEELAAVNIKTGWPP